MKAPATLPFYLYDFGAIQPDSFLQGDSFKLLEGVQTETVDMVFIDPPYFIKKTEWDTFENQQEYNDFMARAFWEAERILKPNGTLALSLSNKAPATTKRGWHGLRKQKAPFALDCKRK